MSHRGIQLMTDDEVALELQHINVKLLFRDPQAVDLEAVIPVFHSWIQDQPFEELLLDVADYRHVHEGPGVVLIGHEADYSIDNTDGRLGLRYNRKAPLEGTNQDRFRQATEAGLQAVRRLEEDPRLKCHFKFEEVEIVINDRLLAPNRLETMSAVEPDVQLFAGKLFGSGQYSLTYQSDPRKLFAVAVKSQRAFRVSELLESLRESELAD